MIDSRLNGHEGALSIIRELKKRPVVVRLLVGHNALRDEGCETLFEYLCTAGAEGHKLEDIALNATEIGNRGLRALARYLHGNQHVRVLELQGNAFTGDGETISAFTASLNTSRVRAITLSNNMQLSDAFAAAFFPHLTARALEEVRLSAVGFTSATVPLVDDFIRSTHSSPLKSLTLNGNALRYDGVVQIIQTTREYNYRLIRFELFANWQTDGGDWEQWKALLADFRSTLWRNEELAVQTRRGALTLLRAARAALLRPCTTPPLPPELILHILSFVAPTLSKAQRFRVIAYATDPSTLPDVNRTKTLPTLSHAHRPLAWRSPYADMKAARECWTVSMGCDTFDSEGGRVISPPNERGEGGA